MLEKTMEINARDSKQTDHHFTTKNMNLMAEAGKEIPAILTVMAATKDLPDYPKVGGAHDLIRESVIKSREVLEKEKREGIARHKERLARMEELQTQREKLRAEGVTKGDLLPVALTSLHEAQGAIMKQILGEHLVTCQRYRVTPFNETHMRVLVDQRTDIGGLFTLLVRDEDVKSAIAVLPDTGVHEKVWLTKDKKLEEEIKKLAAEIDAELNT